MMSATARLAFGATLLDGVLAGASLDRTLIQLPAFQRLGPRPWADFSRKADLDRGRWWYPTLAIAGTALSLAAVARTRRDTASRKARGPLSTAAMLAAAGLLTTMKAAPNMLRIRDVGVDESILQQSLAGFERWHGMRAILQGLAFAANVVALRSLTTRDATDEMRIRRRLDALMEAIRAMDLERVMSAYTPDIVSFDIEPPLQHVGSEAKRKNWASVFASYERPLGYEVRDLAIIVDGDVALGHSLNRISGTLKNGNRSEHWVRSTLGFRRMGRDWRIAHDHVSAPIDVASGEAFVDLTP